MSDFIKKIAKGMMSSSIGRLEEDIKQSLCMQDMPARRFRIDAVIRLSVEYFEAQNRCIFSSIFGRQCIEYVMLGNWKEARITAGYLRFLEESQELRDQYAENWEVFVAMVDSICDEAKRIEAGGDHHRRGN
ncbi:MAG TPA: hypothetical protein VIE65_15280 [Methylobacter sp.]